MRETREYIVNCKAGAQQRNGEVDERGAHQYISNEHDPLELGPPESGLLRVASEPTTLYAVVVFVVSAGHTSFVCLKGFTTTSLFVHS